MKAMLLISRKMRYDDDMVADGADDQRVYQREQFYADLGRELLILPSLMSRGARAANVSQASLARYDWAAAEIILQCRCDAAMQMAKADSYRDMTTEQSYQLVYAYSTMNFIAAAYRPSALQGPACVRRAALDARYLRRDNVLYFQCWVYTYWLLQALSPLL